ncbi:alpha/beta fold hydrolase [Klenkia terrae]|uniref:Alpha/beta hydrolase n=1 Tax=Klenkia terrae TaxID=1052259 RepID=A0ABU8EBH7_9ACTN|nr:alpha/beta hydrolase [Klenkia terrae]SSC24222.1 Epoxide hydrolase-like [Klenkia terrae]
MTTLTVGTENGAPVELYYEDHGAGRPVVLIHGWPLSGRSWEAQVPALVEAGHRVITYDRRGFGKSSQPWEGYDYDTFAADLHTLIEHLDLREVTLVGFSMGGGEVARYVGTYGTDRIAKAVFAAAVPPFLGKSDENPDGALDAATVQSFLDAIRSDRVAFVDGFASNFFDAKGEQTVSQAVRDHSADIAAYASPKGTYDCVVAFSGTDFRRDLEAFTIPVLVLHGDSDAVVPFEASGQRTAAAIPGAQTVVIEGGPHGVNASHPAEFNAALLDFLAR